MPRVRHLSARAASLALALPVALRDGDFSGPTARLWRAGESCDRETSSHASPCGRSDFFRQSGMEHPTAAGTSLAAAPVGPCLRAAGAGIFLCRGVEQLVARLAHNQEVAGSTPAPATSLRRAPLRKHEVDAGATCTWRSCPRPAGRTISKQPCDWRGLSAAGEQGGATATAAPNLHGCVRVAASAAGCKPVVTDFVGSSPTASTNPEAVGSPAGSALQSEQAEMGWDASTERNDSLAAHPRCRDSRRDGTTHTRAPRPRLSFFFPMAAPAASGGARATFSLRGVA